MRKGYLKLERKYYLRFTHKTGDNPESKETLIYDNRDTAKGNAYTKIGNAMLDPDCTYAMAIIVSDGDLIFLEIYTTPPVTEDASHDAESDNN